MTHHAILTHDDGEDETTVSYATSDHSTDEAIFLAIGKYAYHYHRETSNTIKEAFNDVNEDIESGTIKVHSWTA